MSGTSPDSSRRNPFTRRGFIVSAALIMALIAAVIVIVFFPRNGGSGAAAPPSRSASASASPSASGATDESICGLSGNTDTALGIAPDSEWQLIGTMAVPGDPGGSGPGAATDSGTPYCFAPTPVGALFAASTIFASIVYGDQLSVFRQQVAKGELRDEAITALEEQGAATNGPDPKFQIRGFQLTRYSDLNATVVLGIDVDNGAVGSITLPLVWEDGDWKLVLEQGSGLEPRQLNDLSGFIPWSGI